MPGLKLLERAHRLTERLEVLLRRHLLRLRLLSEGLVILKALQRAVVGLRRALPKISRFALDPDNVVPVIPLTPGKRHVSERVVVLALQIIDLRLEFSDSALQSGVFEEPGVKELRKLLARELGALQ
jgi:hypothetical protein